ncbi:hypothetical protein GCM10010430_22320 [Kitasatospora cystarginea]|uniref:Uncharacterized protein n=1 Tax=Kitasatospora cystarginea TaxID=58350 RepID=A0ABP5QN07_9ACTN
MSGCQLRSRYASSRTANALNRERISASAVVATASPRCSRPQHSPYGAGRPQGQGEVLEATGEAAAADLAEGLAADLAADFELRRDMAPILPGRDTRQ